MAYAPYVGNELPNLVNVTKRLDPDGSIADIAEILAENNPILQDIPFIEGNLPVGHRTTVRSDIPEPQLRMLNYGVRPTKSMTMQVDDTICMMEDWAEVDKDLAMLNGNSAEFRLSENSPHIEGMSQKAAELIFYGDSNTDPKSMLGIAPRYGSLTMTTGHPSVPEGKPIATMGSDYLQNIVSMGGADAAANTSVYYIVWGANTCHGIYPKGSKAGLLDEDLGLVTLKDNDGGRFRGYQSHYQWKLGMCVRDWRAVGRVCNIDLNELDTAATQKALYVAMIKMQHAIPAQYRNRGIFYAGAAISAMLDLAALEKTSPVVGYSKVFGQEIMSFRGRPIRECDAILETEAVIV